jgi:hypothetical protein
MFPVHKTHSSRHPLSPLLFVARLVVFPAASLHVSRNVNDGGRGYGHPIEWGVEGIKGRKMAKTAGSRIGFYQ